jgi:hypothetical protein
MNGSVVHILDLFDVVAKETGFYASVMGPDIYENLSHDVGTFDMFATQDRGPNRKKR